MHKWKFGQFSIWKEEDRTGYRMKIVRGEKRGWWYATVWYSPGDNLIKKSLKTLFTFEVCFFLNNRLVRIEAFNLKKKKEKRIGLTLELIANKIPLFKYPSWSWDILRLKEKRITREEFLSYHPHSSLPFRSHQIFLFVFLFPFPSEEGELYRNLIREREIYSSKLLLNS